MRYAIVEDAVIVNVAEAEADFATEQGWTPVEGLDPAPGIGWTQTKSGWSAPVSNGDSAPPSIEDIAAKLDALTAAVIDKTAVTQADVDQAQANPA